MTKLFPKKAVDYFDAMALELASKIRPIEKSPPISQKKTSTSDAIVKKIEISQIKSWGPTTYRDSRGRVTSVSFISGDRTLGLADNDYLEFVAFVKKISARKEIKDILSFGFVESVLLDWLAKSFETNNNTIDKSFTNFIEQKSSESVKVMKASIPILYLSIENPFKLGRVLIDSYKPIDFENALQVALKKHPEDTKNINEYVDSLRKKYQGVVYGSIEVQAEPEKAMALLRNELDKALIILRFFCPAGFSPKYVKLFDAKGEAHLPMSYSVVFDGGFMNSIEKIEEERIFWWTITDEELSHLSKLGLTRAATLILKDERTQFEDVVLSSMHHFSRSVLLRELSDKLVFIMTAAETLLLKDSSEPIQSNLGLRLALISASNPEERRVIIKVFREAYDHRSKYLHHGVKDIEIDKLEVIQKTVWSAIRLCLLNSDNFSTRDDFLSWLESKILSVSL